MKTKRQTLKTLGILSLSLGASLTFVACEGDSTFQEITSNSQANAPGNLNDPTDLLGPDYVPNEYAGKAALGIKNYEQIFTSMRQVTGLADANMATAPLSNISNTYLNLKSGLPASNVISSFSPTQMLNVLNLATQFCDQIINNTAARANLLGGSGFLDANNNIITGVISGPQLASHLANKFWGSSVDADADRANSEAKLVELIGSLSAAGTPTPTNTLVIKGACAAALSSGQVVLF